MSSSVIRHSFYLIQQNLRKENINVMKDNLILVSHQIQTHCFSIDINIY
jgi:hypothetical protein